MRFINSFTVFKYCCNKIKHLIAYAAITLLLLIITFKFIPPPVSAYMIESKFRQQLSGNSDYQIHYEWSPLDSISQSMQLAVIASEDQRFPFHFGIDIKGIEAAINNNEKGGKLRGGSTISQQVTKNLFLWSNRSWLRKGLELPITLLCEAVWGKFRILEIYLNVAQFGDGIFGVKAAARYYFNKTPAQLTRYEGALLAASLPNPILYNPAKPSKYMREKQKWILKQMRLLGGNSYLKKL